MKYFKILKDDTVIGVSTSLDMCKSAGKHRATVECDDAYAEFVQCNGSLYHDYWMSDIKDIGMLYEECAVVQIDESEYNSLSTAIQLEQDMHIESVDETEDSGLQQETNATTEESLLKATSEYTSKLNSVTNALDRIGLLDDSNADILVAILSSIAVDDKPTDKDGYDLVKTYDHVNNKITWSYIQRG